MQDKELHPDALEIINDIRLAEKSGERIPMYEMNHIDARESYLAMRNALSPSAPDVLEIKDLEIPVENDNIKARFYRGINNNKHDILPVTIFFHGGGWVIGDLDTHDVVCRQLANQGNFDVIAIDYRMGPEFRFPIAINDAINSISWVKKNPLKLPIDSSKIALCGDSAGGNIATVCCINSKINSGPLISFQALVYPSTHMGVNYPSKDKYDGYILSKKLMSWFEEKYIDENQLMDWRAAPILYKNLSGLPKSLIVVAGCDPLKDEGIAYGQALIRAGNSSEIVNFNGQIHGFLTMGARIKDTEKLLTLLSEKISEAFQ
ncbi:MAG: acetyl hydrolase [Pelagibacterales bacterium]|nr:acetyl hydrolase [Pelagibacterales bacterium]PPR16920.1 MAG: Carboxylesterase NlhH [Alphaproteobacteria bacterium MarineAlpha9_Bin3]|tara:strand:+ start:12377 stop:13333 length:957 start_codon:yes stop_codon:yes gene_type:complete